MSDTGGENQVNKGEEELYVIILFIVLPLLVNKDNYKGEYSKKQKTMKVLRE